MVQTAEVCCVRLTAEPLKYVADADSLEADRDLRNIYLAATVLEADDELQTFVKKWHPEYPTTSQHGMLNGHASRKMSELPRAIRKAT